jgi:TolA-binding protein
MNSEKEHSPQHLDVLRKQALSQHEVKEVLTVIQKYAKPTVITILAICAFFLIDRYLKSSKVAKAAKADAALMSARNTSDYQTILDDYGSTSAAPLAMMGLALGKFNAGQFDEAEALYDQFLKKHGKHEMALQAEFNKITCREAKGQLGDAHTLYGKFVDEHKNSYLAPVALMGQARCLETMGQFEDAKRAYEDLITFYPGSSWSQLAEANLTVVESKLK